MLQQSASFPAWLQHDMEQVNALIRRQFDSEVVLIRQVVEFIPVSYTHLTLPTNREV